MRRNRSARHILTACSRLFEGLDRSDIYIPGKDDSLLDWLGIAVAMRDKFNTSFDDAAYDRLKVKRPDGGCVLPARGLEAI